MVLIQTLRSPWMWKHYQSKHDIIGVVLCGKIDPTAQWLIGGKWPTSNRMMSLAGSILKTGEKH